MASTFSCRVLGPFTWHTAAMEIHTGEAKWARLWNAESRFGDVAFPRQPRSLDKGGGRKDSPAGEHGLRGWQRPASLSALQGEVFRGDSGPRGGNDRSNAFFGSYPCDLM